MIHVQFDKVQRPMALSLESLLMIEDESRVQLMSPLGSHVKMQLG